MKKLTDYLNYLIGCDIDTNIPGAYIHPYGCVTLKELTPENYFIIMSSLKQKEKYQKEGCIDHDHLYCYPILNPLEEMQDEDYLWIANRAYTDFVSVDERIQIGKDFIEYNFLNKGLHDSRSNKLKEFDMNHMVEITDYLLKNYYDILFLIDAELAKNYKTIHETVK